MNGSFHIGNIIRKKMKEDGRAASWLAQKMCCTRTNIYKILNKKHIDSEQLLTISIILNVDFFSYYSEQIEKMKEENGRKQSRYKL